ncbi:MAG: amino acid decarboxylase [Saprospirales bacterium]|nr:MAG: amino acid decarboxylase [Saprospirales bacterium]
MKSIESVLPPLVNYICRKKALEKSTDFLAERIEQLRRQAAVLEPGPEGRTSLLNDVATYGEGFYKRMESGKSYIQEDTSDLLADHPISEEGESLKKLLELFEEAVEKPGINPASAGHLGYIPGGGIYPAALGDYLAAVTNRYAGIYFANPGAVRMEQMMVDWMASIIPYPPTAGGTLCPGGSLANLIGIIAARDHHRIEGRNVEKAVIYLTDQAHHSLPKALRIAGLGSCIFNRIGLDDRFKMDVTELEEKVSIDRKNGLNPFLILSSAGTTDVGIVDPMESISKVSEKHGLWHHIDAAYGGCFILVESLKHLFKGWEKSDSITIDPHKGLFLPYGTGAVLVKEPEILLKSHHYLANYMRDAQKEEFFHSPADLSPELSRHFRSLRMWLPLKLFGLRPFRKALEEKHLLALWFHEKVAELGFETGPKPELSVVIYRYTRGLKKSEYNAFNQQIIQFCHKDGRVFLSSTILKGEVWLRLAVLSFRTHLETIEKALEMLESAVKRANDELVGSGKFSS